MDIDAKLKAARQNVTVLQGQLNKVRQEAANLNVMVVKWVGIVEYLESIKRDEGKPEPGSGDGKTPPEPGADETLNGKILPFPGPKPTEETEQ